MATISRPKTTAFSFVAWDPESEKMLQSRFEQHFVDFVKRDFDKQPSVEWAFKKWWVYHGPLGFLTTEDAIKYRNLLYVSMVGKLQATKDA